MKLISIDIKNKNLITTTASIGFWFTEFKASFAA